MIRVASLELLGGAPGILRSASGQLQVGQGAQQARRIDILIGLLLQVVERRLELAEVNNSVKVNLPRYSRHKSTASSEGTSDQGTFRRSLGTTPSRVIAI